MLSLRGFRGSRLRVGRNHGLNFHSILVSEIQEVFGSEDDGLYLKRKKIKKDDEEVHRLC